MSNEKYELVFQYPKNENDKEFRFTFEYWGSSRFANAENFRKNYYDHFILNVKDYKWEKN